MTTEMGLSRGKIASLLICIGLVGIAVGFNDDARRLKWSPKYLYEKVYTLPSSSRNSYLESSIPAIYESPKAKPLVRM